MNIESVSIDKCLRQKFPGSLEADKFQVCGRREGLPGGLLNVESKFSSDVTVRTLIVSDVRSELSTQLGEFDTG